MADFAIQKKEKYELISYLKNKTFKNMTNNRKIKYQYDYYYYNSNINTQKIYLKFN